jgi:hypothetical protein
MTVFEREWATYEREKARLLAEAPGKFVVIKGDEIIGVYETQNDGIDEGWKRFPGRPVLTKHIVATEPVIYMPYAV